jgi:hypothetical protein
LSALAVGAELSCCKADESAFQHLGPVQVVDREAGTVKIEVALPAPGAAPELRELLRVAADHDVAVPITRCR